MEPQIQWSSVRTICVNFCLIPIAILTVLVLTPVSLAWLISRSFQDQDRNMSSILAGTAVWFLSMAISIDKFGNVAFAGLFNQTLLNRQVYQFGKSHETVSEVLGWGFVNNDLTSTGLRLRDFLDWIETDHCERARQIGIRLALQKIAEYRRFRAAENFTESDDRLEELASTVVQ